MEALEMSSNNDNNRWESELLGLTPENVDQVYKRKLDFWRVFHSDSKKLDGVEISFEKFAFMFIGNGFDGMDPDRFEVSNESDGFPLREDIFIKEEIDRYKYILKETEGSVLDRTLHLRCELFLKHLKDQLKKIEEKPEKHTISETAEFIGSRSQIALYYAVMQDSGLRPRFKEKIKDIRKVCPQLIIEDTGEPITEKSFQLKYNEITNKKIGYSGNDYLKVEKVISEKYPEALPELKNFFRRDLF